MVQVHACGGAPMKKPDYGIDAPNVIRNLLIGGAALYCARPGFSPV